jgi:hypothetical protein
MEDPLQAMLYIDRDRWGVLDTMIGLDDMFGVNTVFAHLLRLQLLERKERIDPVVGTQVYRECYDTILNRAR